MKRAVDVAVGLVLLVLCAPVMLLTGTLIVVFMGRPVLFAQERPGLHGRLFTIVKFRTMHARAGSDGDRLTGLGRVLRRASLDELPELWNVLQGDMSLVGPRPLLPEYLPLYDERQARRHEVRPGMTGWAQVHGRNTLSWPERLEMDVWYVDHRSMPLDMRILAMTAVQVFRADDVNEEGSDTMTKFEGNA